MEADWKDEEDISYVSNYWKITERRGSNMKVWQAVWDTILRCRVHLIPFVELMYLWSQT